MCSGLLELTYVSVTTCNLASFIVHPRHRTRLSIVPTSTFGRNSAHQPPTGTVSRTRELHGPSSVGRTSAGYNSSFVIYLCPRTHRRAGRMVGTYLQGNLDSTSIAVLSFAVGALVMFIFLFQYPARKRTVPVANNKAPTAGSKPTPATTAAAAKQKAVELQTYTKEEVAKHCKEDDAWIVVDGKVYDVTEFVPLHPGGDSILNHVGGDSTEGFKGPQHPASVWDLLLKYHIGELDR